MAKPLIFFCSLLISSFCQEGQKLAYKIALLYHPTISRFIQYYNTSAKNKN